MTGLALAAAIAVWWLGSTRLALDHGTDASRSAAEALYALLLARGTSLAVLSVRAGALYGWRRGVTAGLGLILPSWPLVALAWSASTISLMQIALVELLLLAVSAALPLIGLFLRRFQQLRARGLVEERDGGEVERFDGPAPAVTAHQPPVLVGR